MNTIIDSKTFTEVCNEINKLITAEIDNTADIEIAYPKLVIMYEFFRLLRGEAFTEVREPTPDSQKDFYEMEDKMLKKLLELKTKLPTDNAKAKYYFDNLISQELKI